MSCATLYCSYSYVQCTTNAVFTGFYIAFFVFEGLLENFNKSGLFVIVIGTGISIQKYFGNYSLGAIFYLRRAMFCCKVAI
jgi:hypothetical protein